MVATEGTPDFCQPSATLEVVISMHDCKFPGQKQPGSASHLKHTIHCMWLHTSGSCPPLLLQSPCCMWFCMTHQAHDNISISCGVWLQVELCMERCVSESGTAAVVDGTNVLLTPVQRALVPPPMCAVAAVLPSPVQCLAFGGNQGREVSHFPLSSQLITAC